ncbi:hypothetical protein [Streptomyces kronopolitis]
MRNPRVRASRRSALTTRVATSMTITAGLALFLTAPPAHALSFVRCSTGALNAAISSANAHGGDALFLSPGCVYDYHTPFTGNDATPVVTSPITIIGNGASIRRSPAAATGFRLLDIAHGGNLKLSSLTVKGGRLSSAEGGGILVESGGILHASTTQIRDNAASRGAGVSISEGGRAEINLSTINDNHAGSSGGGIGNSGGILDLTTSRLINNSAGGPRAGGGGYNQSDGTATISLTAISGNTSAFAGGGIDQAGGAISVTASSITNNTANGQGTHGGGGGIWNGSSEGPAKLALNATSVSGNFAPRGNGGGISNMSGATLTLNASTLKGNVAITGKAGGLYNIEGSTTALKFSAITRNVSSIAPGGAYNTGTITNALSVITHNSPSNCAPSPSSVPGCIH